MPTTAAQACLALANALQARSRGQQAKSAPGWADPHAIEALHWALPDGSGGDAVPVLTVALRDGVPGRALPRWWQPSASAGAMRLVAVRAPRAIAQAAPRIVPVRMPHTFGTATALVHDLLAPERNYLLTCGHVMAADTEARFQDAGRIDWPASASARPLIGHLAQWLPAIGADVYRSDVDGALLEVTPQDANELRNAPDFLPASVGGAMTFDRPVLLRRSSGPLAAKLKVFWSGYVDIPDVTPGYPDYFLTGAIGYCADKPGTAGGDSGAAVWDANDALMGMHIGGIPDAGQNDANAVLSPIQPVLDWFDVQPYTRNGLPTMAGSVPFTPSNRPADPDIDPVDWQIGIVAQTLWGEARGEGEQGMVAVGCVILTRLRRGWLKASNAAEVCRAYRQFSCWNEGDPNLAKMARISRAPDEAYHLAEQIARQVVNRTLDDITHGATHYCATWLPQPPNWVDAGQQPCVVIGRQAFYNNIR